MSRPEGIKIGDQDTWNSLFAPWYLSVYGAGRLYFDPGYFRSGPTEGWVGARRLVLDKVYDVRVVDEGLVKRVMHGNEFRGAPLIDEVEVEVEHIGKFPEGYRHFNSVDVRRIWTLQRKDGGPWRISSRRAI